MTRVSFVLDYLCEHCTHKCLYTCTFIVFLSVYVENHSHHTPISVRHHGSYFQLHFLTGRPGYIICMYLLIWPIPSLRSIFCCHFHPLIWWCLLHYSWLWFPFLDACSHCGDTLLLTLCGLPPCWTTPSWGCFPFLFSSSWLYLPSLHLVDDLPIPCDPMWILSLQTRLPLFRFTFLVLRRLWYSACVYILMAQSCLTLWHHGL